MSSATAGCGWPVENAAASTGGARARCASVRRVPASTETAPPSVKLPGRPVAVEGCRDELRSKLIVYLVDGDDLIILQSRYHYWTGSRVGNGPMIKIGAA